MSNITVYASSGAFGPSLTFLYKVNEFKKDEIIKIADLIENNYFKMTKRKPEKKREFCAFVLQNMEQKKRLIPSALINTDFFQSMQGKGSQELYDNVLKYIIPPIIYAFREKNIQSQSFEKIKIEQGSHQELQEQKLIDSWLAKHLISTCSEKELLDGCYKQKLLGKNDSPLRNMRSLIGTQIYRSCILKEFSEKDLNIFIHVLRHCMSWVCRSGISSLNKQILSQYWDIFVLDQELKVPELDKDGKNHIRKCIQAGIEETQNADHPELVRKYIGNYLRFFAMKEAHEDLFDLIMNSFDRGFRRAAFHS